MQTAAATSEPLFEEEAQFHRDKRRVEIYSCAPLLVSYMRELLRDDAEAFDKSAADLSRINQDQAGRRMIRACVAEVDRTTRNAAYSSRAPNGLSEAAWYVLRDHPAGVEFMGRYVYDMLKADGYKFTARKGRNAVYFALRTLVDAGRITVIKKGKRGTSALYVKTVSAQVPLALESMEVPR